MTKNPSDSSTYVCDVKFATFKTPKGWQPNGSDKNSYAILSRTNESYPNLSQMITVDIGKPAEPTAKASADAFAKEWRGKVEEETISLDGETALRVNIPPESNRLQPIDCILTIRNGRLFMLIAGAKEAGEVSSALDELVKSWKWKN